MATTVKQTSVETTTREPWLSKVDTIGVVDLASRLRREAHWGFVNQPVDSSPVDDAQLTYLPQAYRFVTHEAPGIVAASWLNSGSKLVELADVDRSVMTFWNSFAKVVRANEPIDFLDWEIRIENPPRKMAKLVTMDFVQVGQRKPRIRENPCD